MFQASDLYQCLKGLVGFRQPDDPNYPLIDDDLTTAGSGLYLQDVHSVVTLENIFNTSPMFQNFAYPTFTNTKAYRKGQLVTFGGLIYKTLVPVPVGAADPAADTASFQVVDPFSDWLRSVYYSACTNLAATLEREKRLINANTSIIKSLALYEGYGALYDRVIKSGRFVGLEITPHNTPGMAAAIAQFSIQVDTAQTLKLYLYNSSRNEPVKTWDYVVDKANYFNWKDLEGAVLSYMGLGTDAGASWYFGYYEDDLTGQAVNKAIDLSRAPCSDCNRFNVDSYRRWSPYLGIRAFSVDAAYIEGDRSLFTPARVVYTSEKNWGMNLAINVGCDITQLVCVNKYALADALRMQLALEFLGKIAMTTRIGVIAERSQKLASFEIGDKGNTFYNQYLKAAKAADLDLSGFSATCFPCSPVGRVRVGAL